MLATHLNAIEKLLISQSEIAKNAGHPNLRGGPREWFIREYLKNHLPTIFEIGQGEIINEDSKPNPKQDEYRPQVDLLIYRRDMPKIIYSQNNAAFLAEGVKITIEVKSELKYEDLEQTCKASIKHKSLSRKNGITSYIVAYGGPSKMSTVANWLPKLKSELNEDHNELVEMIIILGKGIVWRINAFPEFPILKFPKENNWAYYDSKENNLYAMFIHMLSCVTAVTPQPDISGYASYVYFKEVKTI